MTGIDLAINMKHTIPTRKVLLFSGQAATVDLLEKARRFGTRFHHPHQAGPSHRHARRISECFALSGDISHSTNQADGPRDSVTQ